MPAVDDRIRLEPGHYASIFISERPLDPPGYAEALTEVMALAKTKPAGMQTIKPTQPSSL